MKHRLVIPTIGLVLGLTAVGAFAVPPAQVRQRLAAGEKITFVDVRPTAVFQKGHIPGAVNIPAGLLPLKELPPLGRVVVYDDGLGPEIGAAAVVALNQKPGIQAEALDGGMAAWESAQGTTTRTRGMQAEELPVITYAHLKERQGSDVVLVDLRKPPAQSDTRVKMAAAAPALSDLSAEFPKARLGSSPFGANPAAAPRMQSATATAPPLLVLIDSGDGAAEAMAHTLRANGIHRFAILAGGEAIVARKGETGLQRVGATITVHSPVGAPASTTPNP